MSHVTLGAAADERKARLAKLRSLKRKQPTDDDEEQQAPAIESARSPSPTAAPDVAKLVLSGRNYDAETKGPKLGFESAPNEGLENPTLEEQAAEVEAEIRRKGQEEEADDKGVDLFKLQPKKPNWDLKRDLEKKLEILNVRTDNAIASLVRERISNAQKAEKAKNGGQDALADGDQGVGVDGVALVEGLRVREREEEEEERREKEDEDLQ